MVIAVRRSVVCLFLAVDLLLLASAARAGTGPVASLAAAPQPAALAPSHNGKVLGLLYDQSQVAATGYSSAAQNFETAYDSYDCEAADDFQVTSTAGWTVDQVYLYGLYSEGGGPATSANVVFYADSDGRPGEAECSSDGTVTANQSGALTVQLRTPCLLSQGRHWLGFQVNMDYAYGQWFWYDTATQTGQPARWRAPNGGFGSTCMVWSLLPTCHATTGVDYIFRLYGTDNGSGTGVQLPTDGTWTAFNWVNAPGTFNTDGPFTFTATRSGSLDVTDAWYNGDVFEVYDAGVLIGTTSSVANPGAAYDTDPDVTFADPQWSSGSFALAAGSHSITLKVIQAAPQANWGTGFLRFGAGYVTGGEETQASPPGVNVAAVIGSATDRLGNRFVAWKQTGVKAAETDQGTVLDGAGIFGRYFGADGQAGQVVTVDTSVGNGVRKPTVSFDASGNFVVGWEKVAGAGGVFGRTFGQDQVPLGSSFRMDDATGSNPEAPQVASASSGQFMAAWRQATTKQGGEGVFGRTFGSTGTPSGGSVRIDAGGATEVSTPAAAADAAGDFMVVWHQRAASKTLDGGDGIFGRLFDPSGQPQGQPIPVNTTSTGAPSNPVVGSDAAGDSVVAWTQDLGDGQGWDIWARRLARGGSPIGTQFKVNTGTSGDQTKPTIAVNAVGDFVVAWESGPAGDTSIFGRYFTAAGSPIGPDFQVAVTEGGAAPESPKATVDSSERITISYTKVSGSNRTVVYRPFEASTAPGSCTQDDTTLCLNASRFQVRVAWHSYSDNGTGVGHAVPITSDTGYFWFFNSANVELVIKVLDGTWLNGNYWVFYGALSDVEYTITVTDSQTGGSVSYFNQAHNLASVADTSALPGSAAAPPAHSFKAISADGETSTEVWSELALPLQLPSCTPSATALCLNGYRFRLEVSWRSYSDGSTGAGQAVALTGDTGYFWFFSDANVELIIKVLDGRAINGHFWVFYGALSDVEYTITVTDTQTSQVRSYYNPPHTLASVADTSAF